MAIAWLLLAMWIPVPAAAAEPAPAIEVTATRAEAGEWLVEFRFRRDAPLWFFPHSNPDMDGVEWRPLSYRIETQGVTLSRVGNYDVVAASNGRPLRTLRIRMRHYATPLRADYTPALTFSDGGLALYSGHFQLMPAATREQVSALPIDLQNAAVETVPAALTIVDPGQSLLVRGQASRDRASVRLDEDGAYIYSGDAEIIQNESFAGVIDPGLPAWARAELETFTPRLMRLYTERLGPPNSGRPMALVAWQGADRPGSSMGGSVLDGMVVMQISGQQVLAQSPAVRSRLRWFIGHEGAHFWLGQTLAYASRRDAWITEGGAQLLAIRGFASLDPGEDMLAYEQTELDQCLELTGPDEPLATAEERGEHRAFYGCGAMLFLAAEAVWQRADRQADIFTFVRALIDANRATGKAGAEQWLALLEMGTSDPALSASIRAFLNQGSVDPASFWRALFERAGIPFAMRDGRIVLLPRQSGSAATGT